MCRYNRQTGFPHPEERFLPLTLFAIALAIVYPVSRQAELKARASAAARGVLLEPISPVMHVFGFLVFCLLLAAAIALVCAVI